MYYTIGNKINYRKLLSQVAESGTPLKKAAGGTVFKSYAEAVEHLHRERLETYEVFGLNVSEADVVQLKDEAHLSLAREAEIVELNHAEEIAAALCEEAQNLNLGY
jgi:hypothetical protein